MFVFMLSKSQGRIVNSRVIARTSTFSPLLSAWPLRRERYVWQKFAHACQRKILFIKWWSIFSFLNLWRKRLWQADGSLTNSIKRHTWIVIILIIILFYAIRKYERRNGILSHTKEEGEGKEEYKIIIIRKTTTTIIIQWYKFIIS